MKHITPKKLAQVILQLNDAREGDANFGGIVEIYSYLLADKSPSAYAGENDKGGVMGREAYIEFAHNASESLYEVLKLFAEIRPSTFQIEDYCDGSKQTIWRDLGDWLITDPGQGHRFKVRVTKVR